MVQERFEFAIVTVTYSEKDYLLSLAAKNEANAAAGSFAFNAVQFHFYMFAQDSSPRCLSEATCLPVGGVSVWGSLGNLTINSTDAPITPQQIRPFVLLAAKMDSAGFFHQMSPGGDESQASVAVFAVIVKALSNTRGVNQLPSQLLFALFQGEDFSHVGSRKFVADLEGFQCLEVNPAQRLENGDLSPDDSVSANTNLGPQCNSPYKNSLVFQNIPLEKIKSMVEIGQIGLNASLFLHRQKDGNAEVDRMEALMKRVSANLSTPVDIGAVLAETPGIPPSAAEAFLDHNSQLPTLVLTDHAGPYANKYFQSEFDGALNMLTDAIPGSAMIQHASLCNKATLISRFLWLEAGGSEEASMSIQADCDLINQLLHCLLEDYRCDLVNSVAPGAFYTPTNSFKTHPHYSSVYNLQPDSYVDSTPLFMHNLLLSFALNATDYVPRPADWNPSLPYPDPPNNVHYHDAVDPNLRFDLGANRWIIAPDANDRPLYMESNWDSGIGWRSFRMEDPRVDIVCIILGVAVAVATVLSVGSMQKYCRKRFKTL